jgi:probable HAF family extracellular repeat protein
VRKLVVCAALVLIAKPTEVEAGWVFKTFDVPGVSYTVGTGINNAGQVVGFFDDATGTHGFLKAGGTFSTLDVPFPGSDVTRAWGINNAGQIVGTFSDATGRHGFLKTGRRFTIVDVPGAFVPQGTYAFAINNRGQIVGAFGSSGDAPTLSGFLKTGSNFTKLDVPGARNTIATGINDAGQIVGQYDLGTPGVRPGYLYANGVFTPLNVGYVDTAAINNAGQIAGTFEDATGQHGFLLTGSDLTIIDVPGASNTYVGGINDSGEVVGYWNVNGVPGSHGFVAVSVPEPASWISLCTGAAIIAGYGWQRKRLRRDAARC